MHKKTQQIILAYAGGFSQREIEKSLKVSRTNTISNVLDPRNISQEYLKLFIQYAENECDAAMYKKAYEESRNINYFFAFVTFISVMTLLVTALYIIQLMETTNLTSRTWLLDALEVITNCCAIASHNQELINSYPHNNSVTEDDVKFCMEEIERSNDIRRTLMKKILDEFDANKNYWCSVKHAVARF